MRLFKFFGNLYQHFQLNRGFRVAERSDRRVLSGEALIDAIKAATK